MMVSEASVCQKGGEALNPTPLASIGSSRFLEGLQV